MKIKVCKNPEVLGQESACYSAEILNKCLAEKGYARIIVATGSSQFETLKALVKLDIDWSKIEMFHLDEYVDLPETHPASFRKYLKERFINKVNLKAYHLVDGNGHITEHIKELTNELRKDVIDLALIGIGENGHIAFNDPPADFDTEEAYIVVELDEDCKKQQVGEGWFASLDEVPKQAISMTVYQIMQSKNIVTSVPHKVKATAIKNTLENEITNMIPATILKMHNNVTLYLDENSASMIDKDKYTN